MATSSAAPLANIGKASFGAVHPGDDVDDMFKFSYSEMPFASHEMTEELSKILENKGLKKDDIDEIFNNDESIKHIDITTFIEKPVSPLVFDSLFRPIADKRQQAIASGMGAMQDFWSNRRAKPLGRFVPAPQTVILAMIRGWFTGRMLGLVTQPNFQKNKPARIVHWQTGRAVNFPHPLLNPKPIAIDTMAAILESIPLAYTAVNLTGDLDHLDSYISLRNYGGSTGEQGVDESIWAYTETNPRLRDWIESGDLPDSIEKQHKDLIIDPGTNATPELRIELIKKFLITETKNLRKNMRNT